MLRYLKFFLVFIFILSGLTLQAQDFIGKILLGINGSQIDGDQVWGYDKPGLVVGGAVEYKISEKLSLQPEIYYSQKGSRTTEKDSVFFIWRMNYFEVPLILNYQHNRFGFQTGPAVNFLVAARQDGGIGFINIASDMRRINPSYILGFDFRLIEGLNLNARMDYSVLPFNKKKPNTRNYFNNTIMVSLRFALNKVE